MKFEEVGWIMRSELIETFNARIKYLHKVIAAKERALETAPEGRLRICGSQTNARYYVSKGADEKGIYVPGNNEIIYTLAQRSYDEKVLSAARAELKSLELMKQRYTKLRVAEECYDQLTPMRRELVLPVTLSDEQFIEQWKEAHPPRESGRADTVYMTKKGDCVRSRAEILISDHLFTGDITYQYESPLWLDDICFHPDFTVLNLRLRKTRYWEHLGMLDDPDYLEDAMFKLNTYAKNGIIIGKNLIITFETKEHPFNTAQIDQMINTFCL